MRAVLAVIVAAVLFGTTGTAQALGPAETTPLGVGVMRLAIGGTGLAVAATVLARRHHRRHPGVRPAWSVRTVVLLAFTGVFLAAYQPLFFLGTDRNGVAVGTVIALGSAPVIAGVFEWVLTRTAPSGWWIGATVTATIGVALLALSGGSAQATDPLGLVGSLGAGASFAAFANVQRHLLSAGWDPFTVVAGMGASSGAIGLAAVPFVPLAWVATPTGATMAIWLGLATTSLAYVLFTWGLRALTAATAATLTLAEPLTAAVLGVTVLGESLTPGALGGVCILGASLTLLAWSSRTPAPPRTPTLPLPHR